MRGIVPAVRGLARAPMRRRAHRQKEFGNSLLDTSPIVSGARAGTGSAENKALIPVGSEKFFAGDAMA